MNKLVKWLVAGVLSAALLYLGKRVLGVWTMPVFPDLKRFLDLPVFKGSDLLWDLSWGGAYAVVYYLLIQRLLPNKHLPSALFFALIQLVVASLLAPIVTSPGVYVYGAAACVFYSILMVSLGRQMEK